MKKFLLSLVAVALLAFAGSAQAVAVSTLMSAQTASGVGTSAAVTSTGGTGQDNFAFQYHSSVAGSPSNVGVLLEISLDAGTHWAPLHLFGNHGQDEALTVPVCGVCRIQARKLAATAGAASVFVTCSGTSSCVAP